MIVISFHCTDAGDYVLSANSTVISVGETEACITVMTVDDDRIEAEETLTVVASPYNPRDTVDSNASVVITDNDGEKIILKYDSV